MVVDSAVIEVDSAVIVAVVEGSEEVGVVVVEEAVVEVSVIEEVVEVVEVEVVEEHPGVEQEVGLEVELEGELEGELKWLWSRIVMRVCLLVGGKRITC